MIALNSVSYPYLAIAQHYHVRYGLVLDYVDAVERIQERDPRTPTPRHLLAVSVVEADYPLMRAIQEAVAAEHERRAEVLK